MSVCWDSIIFFSSGSFIISHFSISISLFRVFWVSILEEFHSFCNTNWGKKKIRLSVSLFCLKISVDFDFWGRTLWGSKFCNVMCEMRDFVSYWFGFVGLLRNLWKLSFNEEAAMRIVAEKWRLDLRVYRWGAISFRLLWFRGPVCVFGSFGFVQALCFGRVWFS